jgi:hypothetical protein
MCSLIRSYLDSLLPKITKLTYMYCTFDVYRKALHCVVLPLAVERELRRKCMHGQSKTVPSSITQNCVCSFTSDVSELHRTYALYCGINHNLVRVSIRL